MFVYAPNLSYIEFHSGHVPQFSAKDGFPCIKEVDIDIGLKDDDGAELQVDNEYMMEFATPNLISMLFAVTETRFLRTVLDLSEYQPCRNLKFFYLEGLNEIPNRSTDHVVNYLFTNCPHAEILEGK
ncbi:hypothetical protein POM88_028866 [Heracleum sosnowskyi]|uniref:Uncharacterized protein n=1 Tax=Heracleum sosnowskyi TaxID=360622 RepID=A0AAD8HUQ2_9APIA|nr:hypothetical protein POM88_028866 [Heracleum sosnowskyi]